MIVKRLQANSDLIGIISATICLIHCIAVPIFFAFYMQGHAGHDHAHHHHGEGIFKVDYIFLTIGFIAIFFSSRHTDSNWIKAMLWVSYVILLGSVIFEEASVFFQVTLYLASVALILAHLVNLRHLRAHFRGEAHC